MQHVALRNFARATGLRTASRRPLPLETMRRRLPLLVLLLALAVPASARAGTFPGDPIDGPAAGLRVTSLDLARDGTGGVAYLRPEGVFVSRFIGGRFQPPEGLGPGGAGAGAAVAAGANGRLAVVFSSGGLVYASLKVAGDQPWGAPVLLGAGTDPAVDMSINNTAYATFTQAGNVVVARLDRRTNAWALLPAPADVEPGANAGTGVLRSKVAVSADGVGIITWGEQGVDGRTHVLARKVFGMSLSAAPQDLTLPTGGSADSPEVDAEDDSSFAWVTFRQTIGGVSRTLARRQRGTAFDDAVFADGGNSAVDPRVSLSGRGEGLLSSTGGASGLGSVLRNDLLGQASGIGPGGGTLTAPAMAENSDGLIAFAQPTGVGVRQFDAGKALSDVPLTRAELGPVDVAGGLEAAVDRANDGIVVWTQGIRGGPHARRRLHRSPAAGVQAVLRHRLAQPGPRERAAALGARIRAVGTADVHRARREQGGRAVRQPRVPGDCAAARGPEDVAGHRHGHPRPEHTLEVQDGADRHDAAAADRERQARGGPLEDQLERARRAAAARLLRLLPRAGGLRRRRRVADVAGQPRRGAPPLPPHGDVASHRARQGRQPDGGGAPGRAREEVSAAPARELHARGRVLALGGPIALMGILNATPDSFSDAPGERTLAARLARARELLEAGARIIDVGGESNVTNRPAVDAGEEIARVVPVVEAVCALDPDVVVSVDTYKPAVAEAAIAAGAAIVNDISGLGDQGLADVCARTGAGLVVMHTRAAPKQKVLDPGLYDDVMADVLGFLRERIEMAVARGVAPEQIMVDPGPDFAKTPAQTIEVLSRLEELHALERPVLLAISRKDALGALTGRGPRERLAGTLAALGDGADRGAHVARVHDVRDAADFLAVRAALRGLVAVQRDLQLPEGLRRVAPSDASDR